MSEEQSNPFRALPSVDALLELDAVRPLGDELGRGRLRALVQSVLGEFRGRIREQGLDAARVERELASGALLAALESAVARGRLGRLEPVVNVGGVVLNTGLGRAPLHPEAAAAMAEAASRYCTLEVERSSGRRGRRDRRSGELAAELLGAEAAICVNNCAAAVLLTLGAVAGDGRGVALSRGELVEIGGAFRMPDVMRRAGARLVEVGTTNRTRIADYRRALEREDVALLLKVHTSNYRVVGFTEEASLDDLVALGAEFGVPVFHDLGSGRVEVAGAPGLEGLGDEPPVAASIAAGVDVVAFSGDKLFGGPQAGILAGRAETIERLRADPVYRAVRLDKVALAGLERTLELYHCGRGGELPVRAMLTAGSDRIAPVARRLAAGIGALPGLEAWTAEGASQPGSGSAPHVFLPTVDVRVRHAERSAEWLARALREGRPAVFARIEEQTLVLDPRTLLPGDEQRLLEAFERLATR
jgi:L-seryl-tRNA(Ser) seleniumtransferase